MRKAMGGWVYTCSDMESHPLSNISLICVSLDSNTSY